MPANLLLHCGASAVDRDALISVPTPESTATWQPIPHVGLLETVEDVLKEQSGQLRPQRVSFVIVYN